MMGEKLEVGAHGWIKLVDMMGDDEKIEAAARQSYGEGTRAVSTRRKLLRFLRRHRHTTPFEQGRLAFQVYVPMDVWRQWIRHRTASVNEYSTRYSVAIDAANATPEGHWRWQARTNRQGSAGYLAPDDQPLAQQLERLAYRQARGSYEGLLGLGAAREQARKVLPLATFTLATWSQDLHNLFGFLRLRLAPDAQLEIREYAEAIAEVVRWAFPLSWEAFCDYELHAMAFSRMELQVLRRVLETHVRDLQPHLSPGTNVEGVLHWAKDHPELCGKVNRERLELVEKVARLMSDPRYAWPREGE